jgi:hypothetical protein
MVYKSISGVRHRARVMLVHENGMVDLAVDCGTGEWIELIRIPVVGDLTDLEKATCAHVEKD